MSTLDMASGCAPLSSAAKTAVGHSHFHLSTIHKTNNDFFLKSTILSLSAVKYIVTCLNLISYDSSVLSLSISTCLSISSDFEFSVL